MAKSDDLLARVLKGTSDAAIPFNELRNLLSRIGFAERIRGSHHIFTKEGVEEILNLQPKGRHAKPYQVKQVRFVVVKYRLAGDEHGKEK
ncbi:MAG: type II toxin-antitoxin system HicA family toxin [Solirubrobacterales bacterium]